MRATNRGRLQSLDTDDLDASAWDALVGRFDDALYDHTAFLGADLWGEDRLSHVTVERDGEIVGAAQVYLFQLPFLPSGAGIAYAKFAPLWLHKDRPADIADLRLILEKMVDVYAHDAGLCLTLAPQADPDHLDTIVGELERLGFQWGRDVAAERRYLVDCSLSEDEQRASLSQKWRYNLKKALKEDITIEIVDGMAGIDAFMALHDTMRNRKNYEDFTWVDRFRDLYPNMPDAIRPTVVIAKHNGTPTAGAVVGRIGRTATYLFGGTDERALKLRAGYALQWWITNWLSGQGVRWYDLDSDSDNAGLKQFKGGLSGKRGHIVTLPGEFDFCTSTASRIAAGAIQSVRQLRGNLQTAADNARSLYRA